jgi:hypothetical protein
MALTRISIERAHRVWLETQVIDHGNYPLPESSQEGVQPSFLAIIEHRVMAVSSPYDFEVPWRPNFEAKMALIWAGGSALIILSSPWLSRCSPSFAALLAVGCALAAAYRGYQAYKRLVDASRLKRFGKEFIDLAELQRKAGLSASKRPSGLGRGSPGPTSRPPSCIP